MIVICAIGDLVTAITHAQETIKVANENCTLALAVDNHPAWVALDIAAAANKTPLVPIPAFFSDQQILHAVNDAGAKVFITDHPHRFTLLFVALIIQKSTIVIAGKRLTMLKLDIPTQALPASTAKITYTSGTTGSAQRGLLK